jgi:hypothetical protein
MENKPPIEEAGKIFKDMYEIAKILSLADDAAAIFANLEAKKVTGYDILQKIELAIHVAESSDYRFPALLGASVFGDEPAWLSKSKYRRGLSVPE